MQLEAESAEKLLGLYKNAIKQRAAENKLRSYSPYAKQIEFHDAGKTFDQRLLMAGNQCITPWTFVETVGGLTRSATAFSAKDVRVHAWDGESECAAKLQNGFLKSIEPAYRLVMESGRFFDSSADHQVATEQGWLRICQLMSLSSGLRYSQRREDYQASCVADGHLCDPRLLLEANIFQELPLRQGDALNSSLTFSHEDAAARIHQCTSLLQPFDRLPIAEDGNSLLLALCGQFVAPFSLRPALSLTDCIPIALRSCFELSPTPSKLEFQIGKRLEMSHDLLLEESFYAASTIEQRELINLKRQQFGNALILGCSLPQLHHDESRISIFYPLSHPQLIGGERILAVVPIGYQPILDAQVPGVNNYKAGGVYHHNCGKTIAGSAEVSMHLTGRYPSWWKGRVFEKPIKAWCAGVTSESTRDAPQLLLMGESLNYGTGFIPKDAIKSVASRRGVANAVDSMVIRHGGGGDVQAGESTLGFKSYDQGREKFQGATLDLVWLDEEPDEDIYAEALTRTNATGGMIMLTFTPLKGISKVVKRYLIDKLPGTHVTSMTIDDAEHYTPEARAAIIARYAPHERDARVNGVPAMGSGKVFLVDESQIVMQPIPIPAYWPRIIGIDFGWDHPTAAVEMAWDKDADIIYITKEYRQREVVPAIVADAIKGWGGWQPIAWPHDGLQHDKGSGEQLATQYRNKGLLMLRDRATFEDGTNGVEAGVGDMLERMMTGKFKIFATCQMTISEVRMYHRKDGLINKKDDDLISASRYAYMMRRKATVRITTTPNYGKINAGDSYTGY